MHRELVERAISDLASRSSLNVETQALAEGWEPDDPESQMAWDDLRYYEEYKLPQFFRGPHLLMLWAAYESSVEEMADHVRKVRSPLGDLPAMGDHPQRDFLTSAKRYYRSVTDFSVYESPQAWERITMLKELRHTLIDGGSRIDRMKQATRDRLNQWADKVVDVMVHFDDVTVTVEFLAETSEHVTSELQGLVDRFHDLVDRQSP